MAKKQRRRQKAVAICALQGEMRGGVPKAPDLQAKHAAKASAEARWACFRGVVSANHLPFLACAGQFTWNPEPPPNPSQPQPQARNLVQECNCRVDAGETMCVTAVIQRRAHIILCLATTRTLACSKQQPLKCSDAVPALQQGCAINSQDALLLLEKSCPGQVLPTAWWRPGPRRCAVGNRTGLVVRVFMGLPKSFLERLRPPPSWATSP